MATRVGRMVTYFGSLLTIKSFYALITCSCKVTWQKRIIIHFQLECLWLQTWQNDNSTWWVPTHKVTSPFDHVVLRDNVKPLYLHYHNIYGHQASKDGDILWQAPNHKVIQSFDHVVLQGQVANKNHHISITRVSMATKNGRMIASLDGLLPIISHNPLITWSCEIRGSLTGGG